MILTAARGGYDMDLRKLAERGAVLTGRLERVSGTRLHFADDLALRIAEADAAFDGFCARIEDLIASRPDLADTAPPPEPRPPHSQPPSGPTEIDLTAAGISSVVWATGYRHDLGWLPAELLDASGDPLHERGVTSLPGFYFLGLLFQYSNRSTLFWGVADDATYIAHQILEAETR